MIVNLRASPICTGVPKNCYRCGQDFEDFSDQGAARVCAECKKPRVRLRYSSPVLIGRPLTVRETQAVDLVAAGKLNKEIAYQLHLGEGTIKMLISGILAKTGMANRTCLAVWWILRTKLN